ncbi:MAG: hypothetical protein C3F13_08195 [Anaerolineales bacterium]|nr:hypothetical protein [Anaerolineae bacterium]PWB53878.1 MAG: hypothetical protein C3F13_08195 [Anaerolineales bacterium]
MKVLFLFLDGIGVGEANPHINPFARATLPILDQLLGGHNMMTQDQLVMSAHNPQFINTEWASLFALDACLGVEGLPQSATGQAALMTGMNVPALIGYHDGPKPTPAIINLLEKRNLLTQLIMGGKTASLVNAFPPRYFQSIDAGYRIPGVIALSMIQAGIPLKTEIDLRNDKAISADFTAEGWRSHLGYIDTPVLNLEQAGERLCCLASGHDLTVFEYWLTDIAGHHQEMDDAVHLLELFDRVLGSLVEAWDHENGLILLTSDHGNMEDLSTRRHTRNNVPLLLIGATELRQAFIRKLFQSRGSKQSLDLTDIAPAILDILGISKVLDDAHLFADLGEDV